MMRLYLSHYKPDELVELYNLLTVASSMSRPMSRPKRDIEEALVYLTGYSDAKSATGKKVNV